MSGAVSTAASPPAAASGPVLTNDRNLRLLRRLTFGPSPTSVAEMNSMGAARWLLTQLNPASIDDHVCDAAALDYSDWDMHAGLSDKTSPITGWMNDKLTELSTALATFFLDLGPTLTAKTSMITLSEFGRRVEENGSRGLDHGHGNAVLLLGGGIVGGKVHGDWLGLSDPVLDDGDLQATTDYRNLLGEILMKRYQAGSVSGIFPGLTYSALGIAH